LTEEKATEKEPIVIKKYANRRLYNTATSSYVTLDHLCQMVKDGNDFTVFDAKTGEDITHSVLTQIIFEEENKGQNMLPINFLRQIIRFYGDSLQGVLPNYLELSMESFSRNQDQMRTYLQETFGDMSPFKQFEEMGRQNMAMFQKTMSMFNPLARGMTENAGSESPATAKGKPEDQGDLSELKTKLDELQRQLNELAETKK
jgi:polyhydroxyalkanoate synthesis repressor PhaR